MCLRVGRSSSASRSSRVRSPARLRVQPSGRVVRLAVGPAAGRAAHAVRRRVAQRRGVLFSTRAGTRLNTARSCSAAGDGRPAVRTPSSTPEGRIVTLTLAGESPLRYFDAPPRITVRAGNQVLATAEPSDDFEMSRQDTRLGARRRRWDGDDRDRPDLRPARAIGQPRYERTLGLRIFTFEFVASARAFSPGTAASFRPACHAGRDEDRFDGKRARQQRVDRRGRHVEIPRVLSRRSSSPAGAEAPARWP